MSNQGKQPYRYSFYRDETALAFEIILKNNNIRVKRNGTYVEWWTDTPAQDVIATGAWTELAESEV